MARFAGITRRFGSEARRGDAQEVAHAKTAVEPAADKISVAITGALKPRKLRITHLKTNAFSRNYRIESGGRHGHLKVFDLTGEEGQNAYRHERNALVLFRRSRITPAHLFHCDRLGIIVSAWVDGDAMELAVTDATLTEYCVRMGQFLALFEAEAPAQNIWGDWSSHVDAFPGLDPCVAAAARQACKSIPIGGVTLARNDGSLESVILRKSGGIVACGFETARFRPRGWDFLLVLRTLAARHPNRVCDILEAMTDGYGASQRSLLLVDELTTVARLLIGLPECGPARKAKAEPEPAKAPLMPGQRDMSSGSHSRLR